MVCLVFPLLAGCRVEALVTIAVDDRGGEVRVRFAADREAVSVMVGEIDAVRDPVLTAGVEAADLRRAGWDVEPPRRTDGGGVVIEAAKHFARPEQLGAVVEELSGPAGPLQQFGFVRERGLARVRYRLSGRIDLQEAGRTLAGIGNDPDLAARLEAAGVDPGRVEELLAGRAAGGFDLAVTVDLPGGDPVRVEAREGEVVEVAAAADRLDPVRPALLAAAVVLAGAALLTLIRRPPSQRQDQL